MINIKKLEQEQIKLAKKVVLKDDLPEEGIRLIAGCDQAFIDKDILSQVAVLDYKTMEVVEKKYALLKNKFPYIPGFLSYRESPAIVEAFSKLNNKPDLLMVDANGILHQRKIGMASHLGILLDIPTIGVAKSLLMGEVKEGKVMVEGEQRAFELKTKEHAKPVYVSPGHKVSLKTSLRIVKECMRENKLPEPLAMAHKLANKTRKYLIAKIEKE